MPTVKEKEKVEKEKRREMQQKLQDGEFISNAAERAKVFKWETDPLNFLQILSYNVSLVNCATTGAGGVEMDFKILW